MRTRLFCKLTFILSSLIGIIQFQLTATGLSQNYPPVTINYSATEGFRHPEKKIVIIITSFKNKDWYRANLDSVYRQNYQNYRVIYLDDNSPDGTGALVAAYLKENGQEHRTTLIRHTEWQSQMANHYNAVYLCDDDEIICQLDGDDFLYDENTLNIINHIYHDESVWITVGLPVMSDNWQQYPDLVPDKLKEEIVSSNGFRRRQEGWPYNHLRTFRAWLFKQIKLEDLMFKSSFKTLSPCPDVAMLYPMYEMAGFHGHVVKNLLYVWNVKNPISQRYITPLAKILDVDYTIRFSWPLYQPLEAPIINYSEQFKNKKCDLIIFVAKDEIFQSTCSIASKITNINLVHVLSDVSLSEPQSFYDTLVDTVKSCSQDYIILSSATAQITQSVNASLAIQELERTFAHGFYLHLKYGSDIFPLCGQLTQDLFAWQPQYTKHILSQPNLLGAILYRKKDILNQLQTIHPTSCVEFKKMWAELEIPERSVGLFYKN